MLALASSSLISLFIYITYGYFVAKILKIPANFAEKALIGLVAANTVISIISLFFPINLYVLILILAGGLIFASYTVDDLKKLFSSLKANKHVFYYSLPFILTAFIVSLGPPRPYDTGLYHLQTIKWIEEFAVVPGLANLHGRFGFNPNIFTFYAATSLVDIFKQEIFSVNFTIYSILVLHFIKKVHSIFKQDGITNILIFNLIILIDIIFTTSNMSSPSPNFITAVLPFFILASTFKSKALNENNEFKNYIPILILCVYVLSVKLATIPLMLLTLFILFKFSSERRNILWLPALLAFILTPWLARTIILTGWLIYPFPTIDLFNFDWKVPVSSVIKEKMHVTGWARNPGNLHLDAAQMRMSEWLPLWWNRIFIEHKLLFAAAIVSPLIAVFRIRLTIIKSNYYAYTITCTSFLGVLFWLLLAPAIQFGEPFLVISAISPLLFFDFNLNSYRVANYRLITILFVIVVIFQGLHAKKITRFDVKQIACKPQKIKVPQDVDFKTYTISGTGIFVPSSGDRCYDHIVPCTPYPDSTLEIRHSSLQSGFRHALIKEVTQ